MLTLLTMSMSSIILFKMKRWKWIALFSTLTLMTFFSMSMINKSGATKWSFLSFHLAMDSLSAPLMILSCWLAPLCFLAQKILKKKNKNLQKGFLMLTCFMMFFLMLTFSSLKMLSFFMCFEATLMPTLMLMTRWGAKMERLQAGTYFLFYTLFGSLPLLMSMMLMSKKKLTLMMPMSKMFKLKKSLFSMNMWWLMTMMAFLMKMPIYGFHLWLPKAHVEAPVAGSMILAAILLKLGGYGMIRLNFYFPKITISSKILMVICCWGALITSMLCTRQTDLKALMAYSSVGHMSLVAAGSMLFSDWSISGAMMLMMAHGLVSSALFALAKMLYERTHTRKIFITRGFKTITVLLPMWWILACAAKLGLPPLPNLMGEIYILSSLMGWSMFLAPMLGITTVFGAMYSLLMFQKTKTQASVLTSLNFKKMKPREHLLMMFHLAPLFPMILKPNSCMIWFK